MLLLSLFIIFPALQDEAPPRPDLELTDWSWRSETASAFPSWCVVESGAPLLVLTELLADDGASLTLHAPAGDARAERKLSSGKDWFLNWADFPAVAARADGSVAWAWLQEDPAHAHSYGTRFQVAGPAGARPSEPRALEEHRGAGEHGFVSLAPMPGERGFLALWLDGRAAEGPAGETQLLARTVSRAGELGPETLVDPRACSCCPTSLVRLANGTFLAAWRDRSDAEVRDIAVARFDGASWSEPEPLHDDGWEIDGCPVNGPRLAAGRERVAATWYTGADCSVRVSLGDARGREFGAPLRVDEGAAVGRGDAVFLADGSLLVGWMEHGSPDSSWRVRRVTRDGELGPALVVAETSSRRSSGFLRMAADEGGALLAFTETEPENRVIVRRVQLTR